MEVKPDPLLQSVVNTLVAVAAPLLLGVLGLLARMLYLFIRSKLTAQQLAIADKLIGLFVLAAEQYQLGQQLMQTGLEKKRWVIQRAQGELNRRGIGIDANTISDIVEAAVLREINRPIEARSTITNDSASLN